MAAPHITIQKKPVSFWALPDDGNSTPYETQDFFQKNPGVFLKQAGGIGRMTTLTMRGLGAQHTLVKLDGIPLKDVLNTTDLSPFLGGSTAVDALTWGSSGVLNGAGATGGVLELITPQHTQNHYTGMGGSHQTGYVHTAQSINTPDTNLTIHAEGLNTAGLPRRGRKKYGQKGHAQRGAFAARFSHVVNANTYGFTVRRAAGYNRYYENLSTPKPQNSQSQNLSFLQGHIDHHGLNTHHKIQGFYLHSALKGTGSAENQLTHKGVQSQSYYHHHDWAIIGLGGISWQTFQRDASYKKDIPEGYAGILVKRYLDHGFALKGGTRINYHKTFGSVLTYTAGCQWQNDKTDMSLNAQTGFLNPSLFDLYVNDPHTRANQHLKPETSQTLDTELRHQLRPSTGIIIRPFISKFHNMMKTKSLAGGVFQKQNIAGNSYVSGLESSVIHTPTETFKYTLSYSHTRYNLNAPNTNTEFPENKISLQGDYTPSVDTILSATGHFVGARRSQGHQLKAYALLNLKATHHLTKNTKLFARIENVFNTRYETIHNFETEGQSFYVGVHICH